MKEPRSFRRLTTRDGIRGPVEEMHEYRPDEVRAERPRIRIDYCAELDPSEVPSHCKSRRYREKSRELVYLIEFEEE